MKTLVAAAVFGVGALLSHAVYALDAPAGAPEGSTALCKDGTYFSGKAKRGACSGHEGIKEWYGAKKESKSASASTESKSSRSSKEKEADQGTVASSSGVNTALCNDGSYDTARTKKNSCKDHQGMKTWYGRKGAPAATAATHETEREANSSSSRETKETKSSKHEAPTPAKDIVQKPGGGAGKVWVNSESKVYHCQGDEWYGKTKEGKYESASQAEAEGAHAAHGKACQ